MKVLIIGINSNITAVAAYVQSLEGTVLIATYPERERGITINSLPEPIPFKVEKDYFLPDTMFSPSPRKNKKKGFSDQPWRKRHR